MSWVAVFILSIGLSQGVEFSMKSSNLVKEHEMEYKQLLSFDPVADVLKVEVPAHGEVLASVSIFDNKQDMQVVITPAQKLCQVDKLPTNLNPEQMMKFSMELQFNLEVFRRDAAIDVYEFNIDTLMSAYEVQLLPAYVQELCRGHMITRSHRVAVSKEEFYNNTALFIFPHHQQQQSRIKRQFLPRCHETADLCTTNPNWGMRCRWLLIPTEHSHANAMQIYHARSSRLSCVMCCIRSGGLKFTEEDGLCKCDQIQTRDQFVGCYPINGGLMGSE